MVKVTIKCDYCGNKIKRYPSLIYNHNFCSTKCMGKWKSENLIEKKAANYKGGKTKLKCDNCNRDIEKAIWEIKDHNFCDYKCSGEWKSKNLAGENNHFYGHEHTEETKIVLSCINQNISRDEWKGFIDQGLKDWSKVTFLNKRFPNCHRHHLTDTLVVCIPKELHNHISHCRGTGRNMAEMNMLALQFINGDYND